MGTHDRESTGRKMRIPWWMLAVCASGLSLLSAGCESTCTTHRSAACYDTPVEPITSFRVVTVTGDDGTDGDILFCIELKSRGGDICRSLDTAVDDFRQNQTDIFDVGLTADAGDLDSFFLENQGGATFGNNEWKIVGLTVEAQTATDSFVIYDEPGITCGNVIDTGQTYRPMRCAW